MRHREKHRKIALILLLTIILSLFPNIEVSAAGDGVGSAENVRISEDGTMLQFMPRYQQKMGYNYGDKIFYKNFWQGQYGSFMPFRTGEKDWYGAMKSMKENSTNVYGRGGEHLVNPNDWNLKSGCKTQLDGAEKLIWGWHRYYMGKT